ANDADLKIRLTSAPGFKAVQASAKYRNRGGSQSFEAEVSNARALAGLVLSVSVDGNKVGSFKVDRLGAGQLELDTQQGQVVPQIRKGSFVEIKLASGRLVASGRF
ncbi:MAG TPA: hypothetical protein VGK40_12220, partial [Verrucomicrobiae bacterium]